MTPTGSSKAELVARVELFLFASRVAVNNVNVSPEGRIRDNTSRQGLEIFKEAAETKDIHIIVAVENAYIQTELDQFGDSPTMRTSLLEGIKNLEVIESHLIRVKDRARYKLTNEDYALDKNRKNDLPDDEARQCLRSHITRLRNLDTSRMDKPERVILEQRRKNMKIAEDVYIAMQKTALNIADQAI